MQIKISTTLNANPDAVWHALQRIETLEHVASGLLGFKPTHPLPESWLPGEVAQVRLYAFNVIPLWKHDIGIDSIDKNTWTIQSRESGGPIKRWDHLIKLEPLPSGETHYTDIVDIEAGLLTPFVVLFANIFYRYRQLRWRSYARRLSQSTHSVNDQ